MKVDGLPNDQGADFTQTLNAALAEKRLRDEAAFLQGEYQKIKNWLDNKASQERACIADRRWFTNEQQQAVLAVMPNLNVADILERLTKSDVSTHLGSVTNLIKASIEIFKLNHRAGWAEFNAAHVERELVACKDLLDRVESKPLTLEQARSVVCFDNRVQVIASAGSGKTSTMVAKAAYAIHRGFVKPERIVLLAFNKKAAEELKERAAKALERLGMENVAVEASTFHALGLHLIGKATKEKPYIPDWTTDATGGVRKLTEIVDQLKDRSPAFRRQWDLFRFVFGRDLPSFGGIEPSDVWDAEGNGALMTNRGERAKSPEEVMIANYLFLNGVNYQYETSYEHRAANEDYRQYCPDFYYPDLDLYHEHFALDAQVWQVVVSCTVRISPR